MLPEFLVGTYRQYKADTKFVATWLATTARSIGYSSEAIPPERNLDDQVADSKGTKTKAKSKSKPKTKKQKRDAARRIPKEQRKYTISIQEFLPLAQYIRNKLAVPSSVPASVIIAIKRVIEARSETTEWFTTQTPSADNGGHSYFIEILTKVKDILEPMATTVVPSDDNNGDESTLVDNMFEYLEVNDPSQEFLDSPGLPQKDYAEARMFCEFTEIIFGKINEVLEEQFAASALFRDIHKIYDHIEQTWRQYKEGKVELMDAAIISNTAIDLIRRLEEDFFEQFPQLYKVDEGFLKQFKKHRSGHRDAQQLINYMYRGKSDGREEDLWSRSFTLHNNLSVMPFSAKHYDDARYVFIDVLFMFQMYFVTSQRMTKSVYQPEFGVWDHDSNYYTLSAHKKFVQDQRILAELLPDMWLLCTSLAGLPALAEDEVLRGTRETFHQAYDEKAKARPEPEIRLWWLVSLRMFCDIHHILGPNIGKPFEAIRRLGASAKDTINECIKLRDLDRLQIWSPSEDTEIKKNSVDRIHQSLFVDEVKEFIDDAGKNVKGWKGKADFQLLRRHPVVCGLIEFNIRSCIQEVGLIAIQATSSGGVAAHLFNALQKEGLCDAKWPDMDTFSELLGEDLIFGGARPDNLQDYCTRLLLTKGISLQTFAQNRRDRGIIIAKSPRFRNIPGDLFLLSVLKLRHCPSTRHREHTNEECKFNLEKLEEALDTKYVLLNGVDHVTVQARSAAVAEQRSEKQLHTTSRYTPVELLMSLQFALSQVIPTVYFDYLSFHKSCWSILQSLYDSMSWIHDKLVPAGLQDHKRVKAIEITAPVTFVFALGLPLAKARLMISKIRMPDMPRVDQEFQNLFNQRRILADMGALIENKSANGRLRNAANIQARKMLAARPEQVLFERVIVNEENQKITFKGDKYLLHTNPRCTKAVCICGTKAKPVLRSGWKKTVFDAFDNE